MKNTVVVVDDDPLTRMDLCQIFAAADYEVLGEAKDGFDAIECCRRVQPDIAIMDVKMPVFGGLGAAETIIQENLCQCVVLLTAYNDKEIINRAMRAGVMAYLVKPVSEKELIPAVSVALSRSREMARMKQEMEQANKNMQDAKRVEQAKGILARLLGITESEAFAELRKMSMDKRCSVAKIAEMIVQESSERTTITKAKRLLMTRDGLSENAAYERLKNTARDRGESIFETGKRLLDGNE